MPLHDIALLYRAHYLTRSIEEVFVREDIPYVLYNGVEFYRRREIKDALCYLRMLINADDISFLRTVNVPRRNIGKKRVEFLKSYAEGTGVALFDALKLNLSNPLFTGTGAKGYVDLIETYKNKRNLSISDTLDGMLRDSGYEKSLMKDADQNRIDNLAELKNSIQQYENTVGEDTDLAEYLNKISLFTNLDAEERRDSVKLMTIHTAKGLEFKYVFLLGMNEGIFPSMRRQTREEMEEERRLAYVAVTRAQDALYISEAEGMNYDNSFRYPSRFVLDINPDLLDVNGITREALKREADIYAELEPAPKASAAQTLKPGDRVEHPVFGLGTVKEAAATGYTVIFDKLRGPREIEKGYAGLKKS